MAAQPDAAAQDFSRRMVDILNGGALNLAMAIGYRTGLFDVMDRLDGPQPHTAIAAAAGLDARYVREWLAVMVTGEVVSLSSNDDGDDAYWLPRAHADLLARRAATDNLGVYTQEIPLLTAIAMESVVGSFHSGAGIAYTRYPRFQQFMTELADAKHRQVLVTKFLPSVDDGRLLEKLADGIRVCDLGCGEGVAVQLMAAAWPASRFVGIDICAESIARARTESVRNRLANVEFYQRDAAELSRGADLAESFDYVTAFDAIHDQCRPLEALRGVYALLRPGGAFSMVDIAADSRLAANCNHPMGPFLYTVSLMHCMPVGRCDGGAGLGMMWGRQQALALLEAAGFRQVSVRPIPDDPFNLHYFSRK